MEIKSASYSLTLLGKVKGVKMGIFVDAFGTILDYVIGPGKSSDMDLFKNSSTGKALLDGDVDSLNWPKKVKWRHERDGFRGRLEECGLYIATDRKLGLMLKHVLRPFSVLFIVENGTEAVTTDQQLFNDRFLTGHNASERHFGSLTNMFPLLLDTKQETDPGFLANCLHIILHAWNIHKDLQDQEFNSYSPRLALGALLCAARSS